MLGEGEAERRLPGKYTGWLRRGDLVTHVQAGGGGFGNSLERDLERVRRDVWNGKISSEYAREHHRVVIDSVTGRLDKDATARLRLGANAPLPTTDM